MFDADLPQFLGCSVTRELESNGRLELLESSRSYFDVKVVSLVRYFEDLGPSESVDPETIAINQKTG